ncbi:hypothetical protein LEP1GSC050_2921 [Leptospira broomii serovar Hurstbridge str. 5399]|uniref:Uncharacterized protein n=1 Tax=Leptospira broomii serovar Hurstbridge str. 5399 TaxID=1049789 RepID=T0FEF5_9LEPT|nr:hypothetical protein LEP1GSC050_2921 [Leptospira broomii serovar Hurstbridge str. 5399]
MERSAIFMGPPNLKSFLRLRKISNDSRVYFGVLSFFGKNYRGRFGILKLF